MSDYANYISAKHKNRQRNILLALYEILCTYKSSMHPCKNKGLFIQHKE